jgi:hypothetical protein
MVTDKAFRKSIQVATKTALKTEAKLIAKQLAITGPTNIALGAAERQIGRIDLETGEVLDEGQSIAESIVNATSSQAVEIISERGFGVFSSVYRGLSYPVKQIFVKNAVFNALSKAMPKASSAQVAAFVKKVGWNGILPEMLEERDADLYNDVLYKLGLGDQEFKGLSLEQIVVELVSFSIFGGGVKILESSVNRIGEKQIQKRDGKQAVQNTFQKTKDGADPTASINGVNPFAVDTSKTIFEGSKKIIETNINTTSSLPLSFIVNYVIPSFKAPVFSIT